MGAYGGIRGHRGRIVHFESFEANLQTAELYHQGQKIPLPEKSFKVLALLLEHSGEMVSRAEVRRRLWHGGTHVEFDHNLNVTIVRLRRALSDSAENPKFIETVARRGYRFIGHIVENGARPEASPSEKGKIRLAVLPFENLCPDPQSAWLGDGLTEEVITRLGHLFSHQLGVIARTSTLKYRGTTKTISQIGRELQVGCILGGGIRCVGDRMRITAQLIRVDDQTYLWAESYEYGICDVLAVQSEVSQKIAQALEIHLFQAEKRNRVQRGIQKQQALLLYLKGRYHQSRRSEDDLRQSVECFEGAIQEDGNYTQPYNELAKTSSDT